MSDEVAALRRRIDVVDAQLVTLVRERVSLAVMVAHAKVRAGVPVYDPEREHRVSSRAEEGPIRECIRAIVAQCRAAGEAAVSRPVDGGDSDDP